MPLPTHGHVLRSILNGFRGNQTHYAQLASLVTVQPQQRVRLIHCQGIKVGRRLRWRRRLLARRASGEIEGLRPMIERFLFARAASGFSLLPVECSPG